MAQMGMNQDQDPLYPVYGQGGPAPRLWQSGQSGDGGTEGTNPPETPQPLSTPKFNTRMTQNPGETQDQTVQRYVRDYWAPDRSDVLGGGSGSPSPQSPQQGGDFQSYLSRHPGNPQAAIDEWNTAGDQGGLKPAYYSNNQTIGLANGTYLVAPHTGGNNSDTWQVVQRGPEGGGGGGKGVPPATSAPGIDPVTVQDPAIHAAIMRLLARGENPLSPNDPTLQAQFLPQRNVLERGQQLQNAAAAERNAAAGTNIGGGGGATQGEQASIAEATQGQEGSMMGQLVTNELASRRADVANALQFAQGEEKNQLSIQLANLDAAIRRQQLAQQNQQFYDQYVQNQGFHNDTLDAELARMMQ